MSAPGILSGRQRDTGLLPAIARFFRSNSAASGRIGTSAGLKSARMLKKYLEKVLGLSPGTSNTLEFSPGGANSVRQTPDRSGLPLEARGVGAERFGLPSLVRGVRGSGDNRSGSLDILSATRP